MIDGEAKEYQELKQKFFENGQGHVFMFEEELSTEDKKKLFNDLKVLLTPKNKEFTKITDTNIFLIESIDIENLKGDFERVNKFCKRTFLFANLD